MRFIQMLPTISQMNTLSNLLKTLLLILTFTSCEQTKKDSGIGNLEFNEILQNMIDSMAVVDQMPYKLITSSTNPNRDSLLELQTNIFISNCTLAQEIFIEYGYPGFDLVGEQSSRNYWLVIQHCDSLPGFQQKVLDEMRKHVVVENASDRNYAYLIDRVKINAGLPQLYGTQIQFDTNKGIAFPKSLENSVNVNSRRGEIGMESLEEYLNSATSQHREMNREYYEKKGILKPKTE